MLLLTGRRRGGPRPRRLSATIPMMHYYSQFTYRLGISYRNNKTFSLWSPQSTPAHSGCHVRRRGPRGRREGVSGAGSGSQSGIREDLHADNLRTPSATAPGSHQVDASRWSSSLVVWSSPRSRHSGTPAGCRPDPRSPRRKDGDAQARPRPRCPGRSRPRQ